jgi:hypothetical protein
MASEHLGDPGASAHRKAQRIREQLDAKRAKQPPLARVFAAGFPSAAEERLVQEERNWVTGARGE